MRRGLIAVAVSATLCVPSWALAQPEPQPEAQPPEAPPVAAPPAAEPAPAPAKPPAAAEQGAAPAVPAPAAEKKPPPYNVIPTGLVVAQFHYGSNPVDSEDTPTEVLRRSADGAPVYDREWVGASVRQSRIGLRAEGAIVAEAIGADSVVGFLEVDFAGGYQPTSNTGFYSPIPRLRLANVHLTYGWLEIIAGQEVSIISPVGPISLNHVSTQGFSGEGNLFNNRFPQVSLKAALGIVGTEIGVLAPTGSGAVGQNPPPITNPRRPGDPDRSLWPSLQGRISLNPEILGEKAGFGVSGHFSRQKVTPPAAEPPPAPPPPADPEVIANSWVVCADLSLPLTKLFAIRGEAYIGANLTQFNGKAALTGSSASRTRGGWGQISVTPWKLGFHVGAGIEDPEAPSGRILPAGAIDHNWALYAAIHYTLFPKFTIGPEYNLLRTKRDTIVGTAHVVTTAMNATF
jgi:hypothetical protein